MISKEPRNSVEVAVVQICLVGSSERLGSSVMPSLGPLVWDPQEFQSVPDFPLRRRSLFTVTNIRLSAWIPWASVSLKVKIS